MLLISAVMLLAIQNLTGRRTNKFLIFFFPRNAESEIPLTAKHLDNNILGQNPSK